MENQQLIGLLKSLTKQYQLTSQEKNHIKFNVEQIKKILAPIVDVKKYQNYGEANLYTFDNKQIDLLALKYVNKKTYQQLSEKIDEHHHGGRNCLICQIKKQIYLFLSLNYKNNVTFTNLKDPNSIIIKISEKNFNYVIKIKLIICGRSYLAITCQNQHYYQLMDLYLFNKYKTLNKLTSNWLKYLLFLMKIINLDNEKNYQLTKIIFLSYLDKCLWNDKWFSLWVSNNFKHLFKNITTIDKLLDQNHFSRHYNSLSNRLFKLYHYDNLKVVYQKMFSSFTLFCNILTSELFILDKNKVLDLNLLIKMNLIILNSKWNSKITFHDKKNYFINHKTLSRLVYNKKLDHNNFIIHLVYFQKTLTNISFDIEAVCELLLLLKESKAMSLYLFAKKLNEFISTRIGGKKDEK